MITAAKMMHPLPVRPLERFTAAGTGAPQRAARSTKPMAMHEGGFARMDRLVDAINANRRTSNHPVVRPPIKPLPVIDPTL